MTFFSPSSFKNGEFSHFKPLRSPFSWDGSLSFPQRAWPDGSSNHDGTLRFVFVDPPFVVKVQGVFPFYESLGNG